MKIKLTEHAKERMKIYEISKSTIKNTVEFPDSIVDTYNNRKIYQKAINSHILRLIVEESKGIKIIVTCYKTRRDRYEL